jgi:hypothetical protein
LNFTGLREKEKTMGMTSAERQEKYRAKHSETSSRLNMMISTVAKQKLATMAKSNGVTQREALEGLLQNVGDYDAKEQCTLEGGMQKRADPAGVLTSLNSSEVTAKIDAAMHQVESLMDDVRKLSAQLSSLSGMPQAALPWSASYFPGGDSDVRVPDQSGVQTQEGFTRFQDGNFMPANSHFGF